MKFKKQEEIKISEKTDEHFILIEEDQRNSFSSIQTGYVFFKKHIFVFLTAILMLALVIVFNWNHSQTPENHSSKEDIITSKMPLITDTIVTNSFVKKQWILEADMLSLISQESSHTPVSWNVIQQIEDILSWSIGLRNLIKGDTITVLWETQRQHSIVDSSIIAIALQAASLDTTLFAFKFSKNHQPAFYDWDGRPWKRQFLRSPVKYGRISSHYNLSRIHPILKQIKAHKGTDFAAPQGSEILALADGILIKKTYGEQSGNFVKVQHDSIYSSAYLHLSTFVPNLVIGDSVLQGQVIGYVGSTGSSTGPHVCLRFYRRDDQDDFVRAFPYLPKPNRLFIVDLSRFKKERQKMLKQLNL